MISVQAKKLMQNISQEDKDRLFKDKEFEKKWIAEFGKPGKRTTHQWTKLVNTYGAGAVARIEKMSLPDVLRKCETKSQEFNRKLREKRLHANNI